MKSRVLFSVLSLSLATLGGSCTGDSSKGEADLGCCRGDTAADSLDSSDGMVVPCPAGRGHLKQEDAEFMNGKACDGTVDECGWFDYCDCTAWCDCHKNVWDCDWVCDDSCFIEDCVPDCEGKECGEDGCGGYCGSCAPSSGDTYFECSPEGRCVLLKSGGATCGADSECGSGWCVPHLDGSICAVPCEEECPGGWLCTPVSDTEPFNACLPPCVPDCEGRACGQDDGCGGLCPGC